MKKVSLVSLGCSKNLVDAEQMTGILEKEGYEVVLDEEMLQFLIGLITREERCKLKDLYSKFAEYGICFDNKTKEQIAIQLQKLNVLERKSDSGEAQYAKVIL